MNASQLFRKKSVDSILRNAREYELQDSGLRRNLNVRDLTAMGVAAIVGAGIFSTIGTAAAYGGPAISLLFVFTAIACIFSALCYAQFASSIPISGSAYTYSYASFGELIAWIIGWDLIIEYAVGNIAVAISWSDYFSSLLHGLGMDLPAYITMDFLTARKGYMEVTALLGNGTAPDQVSSLLRDAYNAWIAAPEIFGIRLIADIPAFTIVVLITALVYIGIRETKIAGNIMVLIKLAVLLLVIGLGAAFVKPENWSPFAPNGVGGVLRGVAGVFFAYIGFDAISTTAEECRNPRRDLPRAMIYALIITTVLYSLISLVLTGMVKYNELAVGDPLAYVFEKLDLHWLSGIIAVSAVIAMASVLLVFQVGQPRIWMSMSRDGLLPGIFSKVHHKFKTPSFSTIVTGILVAVPSLFLNMKEVTDLTSIGTLFAFVLVCGGILIMDHRNPGQKMQGGFRVPYFNSRLVIPLAWLALLSVLIIFNPGWANALLPVWDSSILHEIPTYLFIILASVITYLSVRKNWSAIPVLGLLTNLYLLSELGITNWLRFLVWLLIGLVLYFLYGYRHSKLRTSANG